MNRFVNILMALVVSGTAFGAEPTRAFLSEYCVSCHGPEKQKGKLRLDTLGAPEEANAKSWARSLERMMLGEMPPEEARKQPPHEARAGAIRHIADELAKIDRAVVAKGGQPLLATLPRLDRPLDGNLVPHDVLFNPKPGTRPDSPPRIWLRSPELYDGLVNDLKGKNAQGINQPFAVPPGTGFKDYAAMGSVDDSSADQLLRNARVLVEYSTRMKMQDGQLVPEGNTAKEFTALLNPTNPPDAAKVAAAINEMFRRALQRSPTPDETTRYADLHRRLGEQSGQIDAGRGMLTAILLRPDAIYRSELGDDRPDDQGIVRLTPRETAYALAFALGDRRPDDTLLRAAETNALNTREAVAAHARRLLDDTKFEKPRLLRFWQQYFGYTAATDVFKDAKLNEDHMAGMLVRDTDQLVLWVMEQDRDVFRTMLTTDRSFVNFKPQQKNSSRPPERAETHAQKRPHTSYNLPSNWTWTASQPLRLPAEQRAGILTQPSWLVAKSANFENDPIRRGKWIRENLLGGHIPELPITVDAVISDDRTIPLRTRLEKTRDDYCWNCHAKMNPPGLAFEMYDHFGRFRMEEAGKPVNSTGELDHAGDADGEVRNAIEMIHRLANSDRARQIWLRHVFRFWMGRNETAGDGPTIVAMDSAYLQNNGSFKAALVALFTSDSFLTRKISTQQANQTEPNHETAQRTAH